MGSGDDGAHFTMRRSVDTLVLATIVVVTAVVAWRGFVGEGAPVFGLNYDDGLYAVLGRGLAQTSGYRLASVPGDPSHTKYPFLFPGLLAVVWKFWPAFPANVAGFKLVSMVAYGVSLALLFILLRRGLGWSAGRSACVVSLTATSPAIVEYAVRGMSETTFLAFVLLTLVAVDRATSGGDRLRRGWVVLGVFSAVAAFYTRSAGVSIAVALPLGLWLGGHGRAATMVGAALATAALPWLAWVQWHGNPPFAIGAYNYGSYASHATYHRALLDSVRVNLGALVSHSVAVAAPALGSVRTVRRVIALLLIVGAWRRVSRSRVREVAGFTWVVVVFTVVYAGMLLAWPYQQVRLWIPLAPFIYMLCVWVGAGIVAWPRRAWGFQVARGLVTMLLAAVLTTNVAAAWRVAGEPPEGRGTWTDWQALFAWVRDSTPANAVLAGEFDPALYLYTGRPAVRAYGNNQIEDYLGDAAGQRLAAEFWEMLTVVRPTHLVLNPGFLWSPAFQGAIEEVERRHGVELVEEYAGADPRFRVYRMTFPPATHQECRPTPPQRESRPATQMHTQQREN